MKKFSLRRTLWLCACIASIFELALSEGPSPHGKLEMISKYGSPSAPGKNSSQLRMGLRNDDANRYESSQQQQVVTIDSVTNLKSPKAEQSPVNPMIMSKGQRKLKLEEKAKRIGSSPRDSYLDALDYSHSFNNPREHEASSLKFTTTRRGYTIGPVYRAEKNNDSSTTAGSPASSQLKSDVTGKILRKSYSSAGGSGGISFPEKPYLAGAGGESYYGPAQQISYPGDYSGYESYSSYKPTPTSSYGPSVQISPISGHSSPSHGPPVGPAYSSSSGHYYGAQGTSQQGMGTLQATYSTSYPLPDIFPLALSFLPIDLSWPVSLKIDAFTLIKIVLKLIIFKMIVKVIAGICLLLFIPKLIHKKSSGSEEESRNFPEQINFPADNLNWLLSNVRDSIKHYESMNKSENEPREKCSSLACNIKRGLFVSNEDWKENIQLFKSYLLEAQANKEKARRK